MIVFVGPLPALEGAQIFWRDRYVTELSPTGPAGIHCGGIQDVNPCCINDLTKYEGDFYCVRRQLIAGPLLAVSVKPEKSFTVDTLENLQRAGVSSDISSLTRAVKGETA